MEGNIILSQKEAHRARVMREVVTGSLRLKDAAFLMRVSDRQAKRIKARFLKEDLAGLVHRNRGRSSFNALSGSVKDKILSLHEEEYFDFNDTHYTEMLAENEEIFVSRETVRQLLRGAKRPPKRKRKPRRHRSRRVAKEQKGEMVQWDGSPHRWFGMDSPPCCLMGAVDDATGALLAALFIPAESSEAYLRLLEMMLRRHGAPQSIYQDRHSALVRGDDHWSQEEQLQGYQFPTHVGRVLEELSIESIPAYSPQAKGRVERRFGVLQDRLIAEMRQKGIQDINTANAWLKTEYIDRYNARFAKKAGKKGSLFVPISKRQVHHRVCYAYEAVVGNDNCIRLGGLMIDVPPGKQGRSYAKRKVFVRQHLDGTWTVWLDKQKIATHPQTEFREPVRSWKRRKAKQHGRAKEAFQVYIASKPAPPQKGTFSLCT
ncbi:MAG: ISNCY family transposase [Candidatus Desulfatibia sp.]|uniref:ISNCY family transposase n=1 Tax=Candidatus Desulfatibia sp. TaxID=3101189 RepID=UPI002F2D3F29